MEHLSLSTVFGERIRSMPVSSNKSMIGHTLSAAAAAGRRFRAGDPRRVAMRASA
jgi:3-oxoacyl-[acyl-carrier-protein] synthase II